MLFSFGFMFRQCHPTTTAHNFTKNSQLQIKVVPQMKDEQNVTLCVINLYKLIVFQHISIATFFHNDRIQLIFSKYCREHLSFHNLTVIKDENTYQSNKFSQPIGQYISHSYQKQIYCLKLPFLRLNRHLFVQIQQY